MGIGASTKPNSDTVPGIPGEPRYVFFPIPGMPKVAENSIPYSKFTSNLIIYATCWYIHAMYIYIYLCIIECPSHNTTSGGARVVFLTYISTCATSGERRSITFRQDPMRLCHPYCKCQWLTEQGSSRHRIECREQRFVKVHRNFFRWSVWERG